MLPRRVRLHDMPIAVGSEIAPLKAVLVHRPGAEFDRMWPENVEPFVTNEQGLSSENPDYLLFDDLVLQPKLRAEHDALVSVLRAAPCPEWERSVGRDGAKGWAEVQ